MVFPLTLARTVFCTEILGSAGEKRFISAIAKLQAQKKRKKYFIASFLITFSAFAQQAQTSAEIWLDKINGYIPSGGWTVTDLAIAVESILRLVKTEKPLSIIHLIASILKKVGEIFQKLAELLDKIFPQRLSVSNDNKTENNTNQ